MGLADSRLTAWPAGLSLKCQCVFSSSTYIDRDWLMRFASTHPESFSSDGESCSIYFTWSDLSKAVERAMSIVLFPGISSRTRAHYLDSDGNSKTEFKGDNEKINAAVW